ncbi:helix-turn-helix domain-containing protein [Phytohabitans suffuscus]|uniref:helix-turn-helix domain-containing protein n=1 Tax=Phytohabitans suffuscus TaxID=624315 RepID=UPI001564D5E1|nr:helix-turn-helix transcriptional regulator [Phytohabitans suffuscus]
MEAVDASARLRMATYEMLVGRDEDARRRMGAAGSRTPVEDARGVRAVMLLTSVWQGRLAGLDLSMPAPGDDDTPAGLLEVAAVAFGRLCVDGDGTGHTWAEQSALTDRFTAGAESLLAAMSGHRDRFVAGLPFVIHAAGIGSLSEHSAWSSDYLARLGAGARRYGLAAWVPIVEFFEAFALQHLGEFDRARRLIAAALPGLRRDPNSPWLPFALATECFVSGIGAHPVDLRSIERELLTSTWRARRPIAAHTGIHLMAAGLAELGDPVGARRVLAEAGDLRQLRLVNEDRVRAYEIAFQAALADGDRPGAARFVDDVGALMASAAQRAAFARMRSLLGMPADPIGTAQASGTAIELVRARWSTLANALVRGDREDALSELAALDAVAAELRTTAIRARAVELLRSATERLPATLTPRQLEVAALAAAGMTNREIAAHLFLGVRTVETYISAALRALGLRRRSELGALRLTDPENSVEESAQLGSVADLTNRQGQVAALVAAGCTNAQIARTLSLVEKTVEKHIATIKANLGATSRASITAAFIRAAPRVEDAHPDR